MNKNEYIIVCTENEDYWFVNKNFQLSPFIKDSIVFNDFLRCYDHYIKFRNISDVILKEVNINQKDIFICVNNFERVEQVDINKELLKHKIQNI